MAASGPFAFLSAEQYAELPEAVGFRDELIEGKRVLSPTAKRSHSVLPHTLRQIIERQFPDLRIVQEAGWFFKSPRDRENVPGPDLMILTIEDYGAHTQSGWFECKPVFVVEVVSSSEKKFRRLQNIGLYLEAGTQAVVEVVLSKRLVVVHTADAGAPAVVSEGAITTPFFCADISEIFADV